MNVRTDWCLDLHIRTTRRTGGKLLPHHLILTHRLRWQGRLAPYRTGVSQEQEGALRAVGENLAWRSVNRRETQRSDRKKPTILFGYYGFWILMDRIHQIPIQCLA